MAAKAPTKNKVALSEDTTIVWGSIPVGEYRKYFKKATGEEIATGSMDFQTWLFSQTGKTLAEATEEYLCPSGKKNIEELLSERRFSHVSESDKDFIIAFDKAINERGYDSGGIITASYHESATMIVYGKTGTKSRPIAARIYINGDGVVLRLFFTKIDNHRKYIENAPAHIKDAFVFSHGNCNPSCSMKGRCTKKYTIDGHLMRKCHHETFMFKMPSVKKLPDYMDLFATFYPAKKTK